jgi:translation initiation factor 3 subunit H
MDRGDEVNLIKVDLSVVLKIIKHAKQANFKLACGQLHGIYQNKCIEISNCYPIPTASRDDVNEPEEDYDTSMMSKLEEVNLDNNKVGWYQISYSNDYLSGTSIETLIEYHKGLPYAVYLVYDILEAEKGSKTPFKVYRLNTKLLEKLPTGTQKMTQQTIKNLNFKMDKIYEEIPVEIIKNPLAKAWLYEKKKNFKNKFAASKGNLDLYSYMERTVQFLSDSVDEQTAIDVKNSQEVKKGEKKEEKRLELGEFIESFASRQKINNFVTKISEGGKLQLDSCQLLSHFYQLKL